MKNNRKDVSLPYIILQAVSTIIKCSPISFILLSLVLIIQSLSVGMMPKLTADFFDAAARLADGFLEVKAVLIPFIFLGLAKIIFELADGIDSVLWNIVLQRANTFFERKLHEKAAKIDPVEFENTELLDAIDKTNNGKNNMIFSMGNLVLSVVFFYVPVFVYIGRYLYTLKPALLWILPLIFIPAFLTHFISLKLYDSLEDKSAPIRRENEYYKKCIMDIEYFKETRLLGVFGHFKQLFYDTQKNINQILLKTSIRKNTVQILFNLFTIGGYGIILYILFTAVMEKEISVGAFAAVFYSLGMLYDMMQNFFYYSVGHTVKGFPATKSLFRYYNYPERGGKEKEIVYGDITLRNVSFAYPNAGQNALSNINLTIKKGETVAIVGENGSGKSTICRLITGLYLPTQGEVFIGADKTSDVSVRSLLKKTSALVQNFMKYQMPLSENISISDVEKPYTNSDLEKYCAMADFDEDFKTLPNGYDTILARKFEGIELSGGQWQRVALARGYFKDSELIVLDEPTAAIDPIEETKLYRRFSELCKGKTSIIVTHRLGSVRLADTVIVLRNGELVELGSHEQLIAKKGVYHRMYQEQKRWYENS